MDSQNKSIYFVEEFSPLVRNIKSKIIALTPKVCCQLDKENIPYQIFEDFYDMSERKKYAQSYDQKKFPWFKEFDEYLHTKLKDPLDRKINFTLLYGYNIVSMIDSFIIGSKNILALLDKEKPSKVHLLASPNSQPKIGRFLFTAKGDLTSYLLPGICKGKGIAYSFIAVEAKDIKTESIFRKVKNLPRKLSKVLEKIKVSLYKRAIFLSSRSKRKRLIKDGKFKKILILREDWLGNLYEQATKAGHQVIYHTMHGPRNRLPFFKKKEDEMKDFCVDMKTRNLWKDVGQSCIKEFRPCQWINQEAGADLSEILNPRFLHFLQEVCPIISLSARKYEKILKQEKINVVVGQYKIFPSDFGLMAAAKLNPDVSSIFIEHGGGETEYHLQYFSECPLDIYIASSKEEAVFYGKIFNNSGDGKVKVIAARGWIDSYKGEAEKIAARITKFNADNVGTKENIYYIPVVQNLQRLACTYPVSWYFQLQRDLCKHFARLPQYNFIVKGYGLLWWVFEPIFDFLQELKAPNIFYRDDDLVTNLRQADRVITDYPSTPTYEARLMGLPLLSLYHESISVWDGAHQAYGKTLVSFKSVQEARGRIDEFLSFKPKEYIVSAEYNFSTPTILEVIEDSKINI